MWIGETPRFFLKTNLGLSPIFQVFIFTATFVVFLQLISRCGTVSESSWKHRCRKKQIFWGAIYFCPNFSKLVQNVVVRLFVTNFLPQRSWRCFWCDFHKNRSSFIFLQTLAPFLAVKQRWTPFFPDLQRFCLNIFRDFSCFFRDFSRIFRDFVRILDKSKVSGVDCTPCTAASYTYGWKTIIILRNHHSKIHFT